MDEHHHYCGVYIPLFHVTIFLFSFLCSTLVRMKHFTRNRKMVTVPLPSLIPPESIDHYEQLPVESLPMLRDFTFCLVLLSNIFRLV